MRKGLFGGAFLVAVLFQFSILIIAAYCDGTSFSATVVGCYLPFVRLVFVSFGIPFALGQVLPTFVGILFAMFLYALLCSMFICFFWGKTTKNRVY